MLNKSLNRQSLQIKHAAAAPDLSKLLPEVMFTIVNKVLQYKRRNQVLAARMLGSNRGVLQKICNLNIK